MMADQTRTTELKIETLFVDGDTRTITLKNPKSTITTTEIQDLERLMLNGDGETLIIGDKYGGEFKKITKATRVTTVTSPLDIVART